MAFLFWTLVVVILWRPIAIAFGFSCAIALAILIGTTRLVLWLCGK